MTLKHNAVIYNFGFLKVLLKVFLYFFKKDLGEFFVIIILREMVSKNLQLQFGNCCQYLDVCEYSC